MRSRTYACAHARSIYTSFAVWMAIARMCERTYVHTRHIWITRCVKSRLHEAEKIVFPAFSTRKIERKRYDAPSRDIDTIVKSSSNSNVYGQLPLSRVKRFSFRQSLWLNKNNKTNDISADISLSYSLTLTPGFVMKICRNHREYVRNDSAKFQSNTLEG